MWSFVENLCIRLQLLQAASDQFLSFYSLDPHLQNKPWLQMQIAISKKDH